MKKIIASGVLFFSASLFAVTEFHTRNLNEKCSIVNDIVTQEIAYNKGTIGFSNTKAIKSFGVKELIPTALAASTGRTISSEISFSVSIDGVTSTLHYDDSPEAANLIKFIRKACAF